MAKLQSTEIVGVANRPSISADTICIWFSTTSGNTVFSYCGFTGSATRTTVASLTIARSGLAGAGSRDSALAIGGISTAVCTSTEEYNGSSWITGGNLINGRHQLGGGGTQNLGLAFGGTTNVAVGLTEEYDGLSWVSGNQMITARCLLTGVGLQNEALAIGGRSCTTTEEYNGSTWSSSNSLLNIQAGAASFGTQNQAIVAGGSEGVITEEYNGTNWATRNNLSTSGYYTNNGIGLKDAGVVSGRDFGTAYACTEEYNGFTWSTGVQLITNRRRLAGAGSIGRGLMFGGINTNACTSTEQYNKSLAIFDIIKI